LFCVRKANSISNAGTVSGGQNRSKGSEKNVGSEIENKMKKIEKYLDLIVIYAIIYLKGKQ